MDVSERVMASPYADLVRELNPEFKVPKKPFRRMNYSEAIVYLKENGITKDDGSLYEFGEVLTNTFSHTILCSTNMHLFNRIFPKCPRGK